MSPRIRLLNPGPVSLTERVRRALLCRDLCHREPEFAALQDEVRDRLARVYPEATESHAAVLLTGSGTAAIEAMLGSLVPRDGKALVVANGVYGERAASMLEAQGRAFALISGRWIDPIDLEGVEKVLESEKDIRHVIVVQHETTTGRLNETASLGALCREHGAALLLDAVSSFGSEPIDFAGWNVQAAAATANKCLHGAPGISFVLVEKEVLETRSSQAPSVYLDLMRLHESQVKGVPPFTPAVQVLHALAEALRELEDEGGREQRHAIYTERSRRLRSGLAERGFRLLLPDEGDYASSLTSFLLPEGLDFDALHARARENDFVIYPGQKALMDAIFRLAVMGDLGDEDLDELVEVLGRSAG